MDNQVQPLEGIESIAGLANSPLGELTAEEKAALPAGAGAEYEQMASAYKRLDTEERRITDQISGLDDERRDLTNKLLSGQGDAADIIAALTKNNQETEKARKEREKRELLKRLLFLAMIGAAIPPALVHALQALGLGKIVEQIIETMIKRSRGHMTPEMMHNFQELGFQGMLGGATLDPLLDKDWLKDNTWKLSTLSAVRLKQSEQKPSGDKNSEAATSNSSDPAGPWRSSVMRGETSTQGNPDAAAAAFIAGAMPGGGSGQAGSGAAPAMQL